MGIGNGGGAPDITARARQYVEVLSAL